MRRGTYQLLLWLSRPRTITIGRLGTFDFPAGYYVYTGSAMGGLDARLARHLSASKKKHWHIDYLLEHCSIIRYPSRESLVRLECQMNAEVMAMQGARVLVRGFGSSDCNCPAHLVYFEEEPRQLPTEIFGELPADG
jgi:Uri superfamily endonuclease